MTSLEQLSFSLAEFFGHFLKYLSTIWPFMPLLVSKLFKNYILLQGALHHLRKMRQKNKAKVHTYITVVLRYGWEKKNVVFWYYSKLLTCFVRKTKTSKILVSPFHLDIEVKARRLEKAKKQNVGSAKKYWPFTFLKYPSLLFCVKKTHKKRSQKIKYQHLKTYFWLTTSKMKHFINLVFWLRKCGM